MAAVEMMRVLSVGGGAREHAIVKALDRVLMMEESIGHSTDAVGRMSKLDDKELADSTKELVKMRAKLEDVIKAGQSFLKFTANFGKSSAAKKK